MRLYEISSGDLGGVVGCPTTIAVEEKGNFRLTGLDRNGRAIIVVIAVTTLSSLSRRFRMTDMRADYDSKANAISLELETVDSADRADQVHRRAVVALRDDRPVELQLLYPDLGVDEPLRIAAERYNLDPEALIAAATAALAAPDRRVTVDVAVRFAA